MITRLLAVVMLILQPVMAGGMGSACASHAQAPAGTDEVGCGCCCGDRCPASNAANDAAVCACGMNDSDNLPAPASPTTKIRCDLAMAGVHFVAPPPCEIRCEFAIDQVKLQQSAGGNAAQALLCIWRT